MAAMKNKITLESLIEQALRIPKVKVNREEFLKAAFAKEGILVHQIVEEGPIACDYSDIELDDIAEKLILRRTSDVFRGGNPRRSRNRSDDPGGHAAVFRDVSADGAGTRVSVRSEGFLGLRG